MTQRAGGQGRGIGGMSGRAAAWLAWSLVVLSVVLLVGGLSFALMTRSSVPERPYDGLVTLSVLALAFSVVGAIIASRQPRNAIGWIFCSVGVTIGFSSFAGDYAEFWLASGFGRGVLGETAAWFSSWSWTLLVYLPTSFLLLLFPDGRLPSPRWRPVAWCAVLGLIGFVASTALNPGPLEDFPQITNPYGVDSPILGAVAVAGVILAAASMVASAVSLIVRTRRAGRVERQQIKWLAYGGALAVGAIFVAGVIATIWSADVGIALISIGLLGVPIFTGVAIARYRLYDIDLLINRTLVYAALTALLAAGYFPTVMALQGIASVVYQAPFRAFLGQESALATVAATLAMAALFGLLRRRIQYFIDRRFYRSKYDAAKTLEAFNSRLRNETDLDDLSNDLVGVASATMQPAHVSLWLRPDPEPKARSAALRQFGHE